MNKFVPLKYISEREGEQIEIELPFVLGIMTHINRTAVESKTPFESRRFVTVDLDNTQEFFDVMRPSITVDLTHASRQILISFSSFEDIHPVRLKQHIEEKLISYDGLTLSEADMQDALAEILQHQGLQQLLDSLRGIYQLLDNKLNESNLVIRVLDVSKQELINDVKSGLTPESCLYRSVYLHEYGTFEGTPYSLVLTDFEFSHNDTDMSVIEYLARLGAKADCVFLLKPESTIFGTTFQRENIDSVKIDTNFSSREFLRWRALRDHESSRFIVMMVALRPSRTVTPKDIVNPVFSGALNILPFFTGSNLWNFIHEDNAYLTDSKTELTNTQSIKALKHFGFNIVNADTSGLLTPVSGIVSLQSPRKYFDQSSNEIASVMASVPYHLIATAFVRYITMITRETLGLGLDNDALATTVNQWLKLYIDGDDKQNRNSFDLLKPLTKASVLIDEVAGVPGLYRGLLKIQLEIEGFSRTPCTHHQFNVLSIF